jgi:hypothetical protein
MVVPRGRTKGHASMTCPFVWQHRIIDAPLAHAAIAYESREMLGETVKVR